MATMKLNKLATERGFSAGKALVSVKFPPCFEDLKWRKSERNEKTYIKLYLYSDSYNLKVHLVYSIVKVSWGLSTVYIYVKVN